MALLNLILVAGIFAFAYFSPTIFFGTSFPEIIKVKTDPNYQDAETLSQIAKALNLTPDTLEQTITKAIFVAVGIVLVGIVLLVLFNAVMKKMKK